MLISDAAVVAEFAEQVRATGATLHRCPSVMAGQLVVAEIVQSLAERDVPAVAATKSAMPLLPDGVQPVVAEQRPAYLDLAVSTAVLGVAETGSVLLAPRSRWDRLLGILARVHVIAIAEQDVRGSLDDVAGAVTDSDAPYLSLVTGPTRTADIERVITVGAHGPAAVHVLLLGESLHA
jgi:L-lactate dehydrogenase complex protein LldG